MRSRKGRRRRISVDSGIEGGTEKERTREKEEGKRSATKVAVMPCKASKPNGQPRRKKMKRAALRGNAERRGEEEEEEEEEDDEEEEEEEEETG